MAAILNSIDLNKKRKNADGTDVTEALGTALGTDVDTGDQNMMEKSYGRQSNRYAKAAETTDKWGMSKTSDFLAKKAMATAVMAMPTDEEEEGSNVFNGKKFDGFSNMKFRKGKK